MDLVARKMKDGGETAARLIDEIEAQAEAARETLPELAEAVWQATETLREATEWLVAETTLTTVLPTLCHISVHSHGSLGAHFHLGAAMAEPDGPRAVLAEFYIARLLPEHAALLTHAQSGTAGL